MSDAKFWLSEIARSREVGKTFESDWQTNLDYYTGKNPDAAKTDGDFVNVNVDFYETELKTGQLFYETPELQLVKKGAFYVVNDATAVTPGSTVAGGGSNFVIVWSNGTDWKIVTG